MSNTPLLGLPEIAAGQNQKEVPHNDALLRLENRIDGEHVADLSGGDVALTLDQVRQASILVADGAAVARTLTLPAFAGHRMVRSTSSHGITLSLGSTDVAIPPGTITTIRGDGTANGLEVLVAARAPGLEQDIYDIAMSTTDLTPLANSQVIARHGPVRSMVLPISLTGSRGGCGVAPTADATITIKKNGSTIGTINIASGDNDATFTFAAAVTITNADLLLLIAQTSADATLAGVWVTFKGRRA